MKPRKCYYSKEHYPVYILTNVTYSTN